MASHLGVPVGTLQRQISSSEFTHWIAYLKSEHEREYTEHGKLEYYLAGIAAEIRRGQVKNPRRVKDEHFLINFKTNEEEAKDHEAAAQQSRDYWLTLLDFTKKD